MIVLWQILLPDNNVNSNNNMVEKIKYVSNWHVILYTIKVRCLYKIKVLVGGATSPMNEDWFWWCLLI